MKYCLLILVFSLISGGIVKAQPNILPDFESYQDFLIKPWKAGAPTIVVFKDPYCPYCVRALKQLNTLDNYNVFMFWAPILGKSSILKVNKILACTSPVSVNVFEAIIKRSKIVCDKSNNERLKELNQKVVDSYNPNSVPSYYFGGKKVSLSTLSKVRAELLPDVTPTKLNWSRYSQLKVGQAAHNGLLSTVIFSPSNLKTSINDLLNAERLYSWYLVDQFCLPHETCTSIEKKAQELRLLLGQKDVSAPTVFIEGRKIEPHNYPKYFSAPLVNQLTLNSVTPEIKG